MAEATELTPSEYIEHHLSFFVKPLGGGEHGGGFWALNVDSIVVSVLLGFVGLGLIWWVVRGATSGVPSKRQALFELPIDFVDEQAKGIFLHGDRHRFIAPLALTVFVWVVLMNAMDFLPADLVGLLTHHVSEHGFRYVPTADVNTTFALSISVLVLSIYFAIAVKGFGGWLHELFFAPFGTHPLLIPANFLFQMVEYISKTLSHSLRLFGNMYAGEILILPLWMLAATSIGRMVAASVLPLGSANFDIFIVLLHPC